MKYSLGNRFLANETKQSCCTFVEQVLESLVVPIEILEHRQDHPIGYRYRLRKDQFQQNEPLERS